MKTSSPLRYPGGKSSMSGLLASIRKLNRLGDRSIAEPFAGGAGASLTLLYREEVGSIFINDADPAIYDFWWSLTRRSKPFIDMISKTEVNIDEWHRQRDTYRTKGRLSRMRRGFAAFYLNRCNRSGIIMNGGPIGGIRQEGKWKIDARFNKENLRQRCEKVAEYRDRIHVSSDDGIDFINRLDSSSIFFFIDPPYFEKGPLLYLNSLDNNYHETLANRLRKLNNAAWVLTYDDCPEIRKMYEGWAAIRPFTLRYAAAKKRAGNEVLISPKWLQMPEDQLSAAISW